MTWTENDLIVIVYITHVIIENCFLNHADQVKENECTSWKLYVREYGTPETTVDNFFTIGTFQMAWEVNKTEDEGP